MRYERMCDFCRDRDTGSGNITVIRSYIHNKGTADIRLEVRENKDVVFVPIWGLVPPELCPQIPVKFKVKFTVYR